MADLNIISVSNIKGKTFGNTLLTVTTDLVTNTFGQSKLFKINNIILNNKDTTNTLTANISFVDYSNSNTSTPIIVTLDVPSKSVIDVLSKPIYLEEGDKITAAASANSNIGIVISYEELA